ncbi:MAG: protein translocase subunit SecF, partial [Gemmatimonadetes bacterium]|nr:protein translocase subunit SecF [Gemmatimonadota bacterium]
MFRILYDTHVDFLGVRRWAYGITAVFVFVGAILLAVRGLNESIEFTGGTLIQVTGKSSAVTTASIRTALAGAGLTGSEIQTFGGEREFVIRARLDPRASGEETSQQTAEAVGRALAGAFGESGYEIVRTEAVGPKVGGELRQKAVMALLLSFAATLLYLWLRFEWRFAVAAVLATVYDILATIAFIAMLHLEVSLVLVAAVLTIIGYSLNDKIVNFDRVRENLRKYKRTNFAELLNRSINEVLPRTVMTGGGTIVAIFSLLVFGGEVIRDFAWVMNFGI